jgi:hypothetical protein
MAYRHDLTARIHFFQILCQGTADQAEPDKTVCHAFSPCLSFVISTIKVLLFIKYAMINPPKVDYGLFRATRFHNPPSIRALVVLSHHYALM